MTLDCRLTIIDAQNSWLAHLKQAFKNGVAGVSGVPGLRACSRLVLVANNTRVDMSNARQWHGPVSA